MLKITPASLGSVGFRSAYKVKYAYLVGAMYKGISSAELVIKLGQAGLMGYLGTGGLRLSRIESDIQRIQQQLGQGQSYGVNLLCNLVNPKLEEMMVELFLRYGIRHIEAAAYMQITPALVQYRLKGIHRNSQQKIVASHFILAKISRPEVAQAFMSPPPPEIVSQLVQAGKLTREEAFMGEQIPMASEICVEADSGGHTDRGVAYVLMPTMLKLRSEITKRFEYSTPIYIGAAGGIGTPESAAAAFMLGADFIMTGSINQCTVESGASNEVKDMLQSINVQDTTYAPAGDMFEIGARVQVLKKGVLFAQRANKLYDLYRQYNSLDEIDEKTKKRIQEKYFCRSFKEVWEETCAYYLKEQPSEIVKAEQNPKYKMSLIFRWYFIHTTRLALSGMEEQKVNYQVHTGPALGAFNQWVKGTAMEKWYHRHVDEIAEKIMQETSLLVLERIGQWNS